MLNITQRQINLKFLGFYKGQVDGIEGKQTKQAYVDFQRAFKLTVDGIYGAKTDSLLTETIKSIQSKIGANTDGIAGNETINKCKEYQKANGLAVDGICGAKTRAKLNESSLSWDNIKYFKKSEFDCPCCGKNNINLSVVKIADEIREHFGKKGHVNSGTRCEKHNKEVKGETNSRHLVGKAIDIWIEGISGGTLLSYTKQLVSQGKLRYTYRISSNGNAVHIDIN